MSCNWTSTLIPDYLVILIVEALLRKISILNTESVLLVVFYCSAAAAKSLQSCPTLCDPIDGSRPGCPVPGILQARTLEWVAISFSNAWKLKVKVKSLSCVQLLATTWTAAYSPSMGFSRQEYWSGVPLSMDCKEIQPVHPKRDQPWVCIGRTDAEAETPVLWLPHVKIWLLGKDPDAERD